MKFIYATDLHGNMSSVRATLQTAKKMGIKNIIFGGDVSPRRMAVIINKELIVILPTGQVLEYKEKFEKESNCVIMHKNDKSIDLQKMFNDYFMKFPTQQAAWLSSVLLQEFMDFKKSYQCKISIMGGNNDPKKLVQIFNEAESNGIIQHLHNKVFVADDTAIAGCPFLSPTPFRFDYWEKPEKEIYTDLKELSSKTDMHKTILVTHVPPKDTPLDIIHSGKHVGSKALRRFIEEYQPLLCLSGHIHEAPKISNKWLYKIGKTTCINHGDSEDKTRMLIGDTERMNFKLV
ncbi:MAG: metallophosphoesterase family protein [Candidatus Aenigmarchaeota archaeon]|nr:metallophosphoesterase family protein [Candidatus Aenigmarchaeota archaeon]